MTFNLLQTTPPACSHLPYAKHRGGLFHILGCSLVFAKQI